MTNQIKAIRKSRGLTQQDVADALGTVKSAVSQWETGYMGMSVTTICRLADLLGERVTLAASELVEDPWEITIEMTLIPNNGTAKSESLTWDAIEAALDYGAFHGLGQWRNADYGRFMWEQVEE